MICALLQSEDMPSEMAQEATEIITAGVDKFISTDNFEKAAQNIKEALDKKFGPTWHVCVGEVRTSRTSNYWTQLSCTVDLLAGLWLRHNVQLTQHDLRILWRKTRYPCFQVLGNTLAQFPLCRKTSTCSRGLAPVALASACRITHVLDGHRG